MPQLGTLTGRQAASLAGLAPHPHQSGQRDGYRRTRGGRVEIKRSLFMAAMAARNHHPTLKAVYQRLVANGKKPPRRHHRTDAKTHHHHQRTRQRRPTPNQPKTELMIAPLRQDLDAPDFADYLSLWSGQSAALSGEMPAHHLVATLAAEASAILDPIAASRPGQGDR